MASARSFPGMPMCPITQDIVVSSGLAARASLILTYMGMGGRPVQGIGLFVGQPGSQS